MCVSVYECGFSFLSIGLSQCVRVRVIRAAQKRRNTAPVTCCIIVGAGGDWAGWLVSMEGRLPVFEGAKIEQYKAWQGKGTK